MKPTSILSLSALAASVSALVPIEIRGNKFVKPGNSSSEDEIFQVIGIDYQPGGASGYSDSADSDALSDVDTCLRDAYILQKLGVNTIRVYTLSPWINHDECMSILNGAGIYVILDVNTPLGGQSLNRDDPKGSYNAGYVNRVFGFLDAFMGYPNVLGFFSGNEVFNNKENAETVPPYIKALQRDMKAYISNHGDRDIPVGYSAADDTTLGIAGWQYLECGDEEVRSDFYGLNTYQWCGGATWDNSGYGTINSSYADSAIPLIFSEYGCNKVRPRTFDEVDQGLYGGLKDTFSGGLIYEYSEEDNNYGLVEIDSDGNIELKEDYYNLQKAYANISKPSGSASSLGSEPTIKQCNSTLIKKTDQSFNSTTDLPPSPVLDTIKSGSGNNNVGKIVDIPQNLKTNYTIKDKDGNEIKDPTVVIDAKNLFNGHPKKRAAKPDASSSASSASEPSATSAAASSSPSASASSTDKKKNGGVVQTVSMMAVLGGVAVALL